MSTKLGMPDVEGFYCSVKCKAAGVACDLCIKQRERERAEAMRQAGKPTLTHNPFATKLRRQAQRGSPDAEGGVLSEKAS
jgi:hypothetical protein